jgi:hypothetical protein
MKLFGGKKDVDHLRIKEIQAARAVMVLYEEAVECNITLITEDGERLELTLPDRVLPNFIMDLTDVYEAIHPPLRRGNRQSTWMGMKNE